MLSNTNIFHQWPNAVSPFLIYIFFFLIYLPKYACNIWTTFIKTLNVLALLHSERLKLYTGTILAFLSAIGLKDAFQQIFSDIGFSRPHFYGHFVPIIYKVICRKLFNHLGLISNLVHRLTFGTPKFYTAFYSKINHRLIRLSNNCNMKLGLRINE